LIAYLSVNCRPCFQLGYSWEREGR